MSKLSDQLKDADLSSFRDVHGLTDELDQLLWVLYVARSTGVAEGLTASQAAESLRDAFGIAITRQRAAALLASADGFVAVRRRTREAEYAIMKKGVDRVSGSGDGVLVVEPSQAFTALQRVESILQSLAGDVLICDPYVDDKTLVHLTSVATTASIKLLTQQVSDPARFRIRMQAYSREFGNLEIRIDAKGDLHDRYVIDQSTMWSFGQSLNGIGKKQTIVVRQGVEIADAMRKAFMARWNVASKWT